MKTSIIIALLIYILIMLYNKVQKDESLKMNTINTSLLSIALGFAHFYFNDMEDFINEPF